MEVATREKVLRTLQFDIQSINEETRTFTAVASDASLDRHEESIDQSGWVLDNYLKNPVVLYGHDYFDPPVAKTLNIGVDNQGRLLFSMQWATADEYEFADTVYKLYKGGYMRAFSVGFIPLEMEGMTYTKMELLEISAVTVPSNPNALALAYKEGVIGESERKKMIATHKNILKSLTEVEVKEQSDDKHKEFEMSPEALEAVKELRETVKSLADVMAEVKDALVQNGDKVEEKDNVVDRDAEDKNEDADTENDAENEEEAGDKSSDENEDGGAQDDSEIEVSDEDAQKIVDAAVEEALKEAKGQVD